MEQTKKEQLEALGINVDSALTRFMGLETLLIKSLTLFASDTTIETLKTAMQNNDAQSAYNAVHTIKGICGNLSMDALFLQAAKLCELLSAQDTETAKAKVPEFIQNYEAMLEGIKKWM